MRDVDTAIIGAGPYGLALAAHLVKRGRSDIRIFGEPNWFTRRNSTDHHGRNGRVHNLGTSGRIGGRYRVRLPPHDMVLIQPDKALFHKFAVANGLPVPNAVIVGGDEEICGVRDLRFPVVIKQPANGIFI